MASSHNESLEERRQRGRAAYASQFALPEDEVLEFLTSRFGTAFANEALLAAGGAWSDDLPLSRRERSLIVLAALATQGGSEARMRPHVRWAVEHGVTREDLEALGAFLAVYAGYPRASVALETIRGELDALT
jgi:4-carboxymuconolactone decarboxylase